jgi:hypothetical protein
VRGARRARADQREGPRERAHPMRAMGTKGQRTATRLAPLLLDGSCEACARWVCGPALRPEGPLLGQEMVGNQPTIDRPMCI